MKIDNYLECNVTIVQCLCVCVHALIERASTIYQADELLSLNVDENKIRAKLQQHKSEEMTHTHVHYKTMYSINESSMIIKWYNSRQTLACLI